MQASIEELDSTVGFASYSAIKTTQDEVGAVSDQIDELENNIKNFRATLHEDVQALYASNLNLEMKITQGFVAMREMHEADHLINVQVAQQLSQFVEKWERSEKTKMSSTQSDRKMQSQKANAKGDVGDNKAQAIGRLKEFFNERRELFPSFQNAHADNQATNDSIKQSFVDGTATWLVKDPDYNSWLGGDKPLLWIRGSDGVGKSYIAHATARKFLPQTDTHRNVVYFYFRSDSSYSMSVQNAFVSAALQISESSSRYAEQIAAKIKEDAGKDASKNTLSTWKRFLLPMFIKDGEHHLYMVLDGLDEIDEKEKKTLVQFFEEMIAEKSKISVLVTSRPEVSILDHLNPAVVDVAKEKIAQDLKALIRHRLKSLPRLKKFSHPVKQVILRKVVKTADSKRLNFCLKPTKVF